MVDHPTNDSLTAQHPRIKPALALLTLLVIMAFAWSQELHHGFTYDDIRYRVEQAGQWGLMVYVVLFAMSVIFVLPASALTLVGVTLFEPLEAYMAILAGAMLGALSAFFIGRTLARDYVSEKLSRAQGQWGNRGRRLDLLLQQKGFAAMLYVRLGFVPFPVASYAASLSSISWRDYALGTCLGILPQIFVFVWLGQTLKRLWLQGWYAMLTAWESWAAILCFALVFSIPMILSKLGLSHTLLRGRKADND